MEKEWDGIEVDMMLGEDTFDLGPDEEEDFTVTFNGQTRLSSELSYGFTLVATVPTSPCSTGPKRFLNATVSGDLNIATFGMVDLEISDKSTRTLSGGDETKISFQFQNNGDDDDKFRSPSPTPLNSKKQALPSRLAPLSPRTLPRMASRPFEN